MFIYCVYCRIMQHTENIDSLRELSLLSDVIHCVQYCTDKLLNELELAKIQIECKSKNVK